MDQPVNPSALGAAKRRDGERRREAFAALTRASREVARVAGALDLSELTDFILAEARALLGAERGVLVLDDDGEPAIVAVQRLERDAEEPAVSRTILHDVLRNGRAVATIDAQEDPRYNVKESILGGAIRSVAAVPLVTGSGVIGALYLDSRLALRVFDGEDLEILEAFAGLTAAAIATLRLLKDRRDTYLESVRALVGAVDAKDAYTAGHSARVGSYAEGIVRAMGRDAATAERALIAGLLHDVGKIGVSDAPMRNPGLLETGEWEEIKRHTLIGERILAPSRALSEIVPAVRSHHERWDGSGYPDGLRGEEIPFLARVIGVADAFDAMTSDRPYRNSLGRARAFDELRRGAGSHFDREVVEAFGVALARSIVRYQGKG